MPWFNILPTRTNSYSKSLKTSLIVIKRQQLGIDFHSKDCIPKQLSSGVNYNFQCGICNKSYYGECVGHLNVRIGEHIGISPFGADASLFMHNNSKKKIS